MDDGAQDEDDGDPAVARVRRDLAELGSDGASAADVPEHVTSRVVAALRAEPAHTVRRQPLSRPPLFALIVGVGAAVAAVVVGASTVSGDPTPTYPAGPTAEKITVARPAATVPLPEPQILALLTRPPDYGPLSDPGQRGSCLDRLGYGGTAVLGATPLDMHGKPTVLMVLPGDAPDLVVAVVVDPNCGEAHPGLLARTVVTRT
jgi:hypothetical protein